ncbi:MAG: acyl-CoA dehydratase activase [Bacteroidota bacterium]|nr:acyl-CoA dehydratase activase [Bacteroidota bacterium]
MKQNTNTRHLGICIGASSVSMVELEKTNELLKVLSYKTQAHHGNPKQIVEEIFSGNTPDKIVVTGRKFRNLLNITSIPEPEAVELAADYLQLDTDIIISAGGENFIIYLLDKNRKISKCMTGNKCASGTGEFFLQQIKRMNLSVEEAISLSGGGDAYNISGRCSVFCKSDCTHALNKGIPKQDVIAGLCRMMANKIIELTSHISCNRAVIIGGVARNHKILNTLHEHFNELIVPDEAAFFEALGAAIHSAKNDLPSVDIQSLFRKEHVSFTFHQDLKKFVDFVDFKEFQKGTVAENDICILGLDVGSTTTKAIMMRVADNAVLASEYLRTNGDPIQASIECYQSLKEKLAIKVKIIGLGVTGSGRHISGLHANTKGIVNEILAHANATIYFDKDVDTIFEIGGQDAKYTYITAGVPSDYAMNEACSAGTGSFLEEAAKESLNIDYKLIGDIALKASNPPNFNDQCSAFISSDVKNALHEGLNKEDIVAGLVYSICLNFTNRVKGNRPVGNKVFMQGGVCYNKAVPIAMAALTGKHIIVPPEPGLMGAFGVALEIKERLALNLFEEQHFDLDELINRKVEYGKSFICAGQPEGCDRKCNVNLILIEGKKIPFGGACNKYYDYRKTKSKETINSNLVKVRQDLVFEKYIPEYEIPENAPVIAIPKSFLVNTLYPLYYNFFSKLGFKVILGEDAIKEGIDKQQAAFCYPVELAHGFFQGLIDLKPDYIFLPHITEIYDPLEKNYNKTCVLLQSEAFYLRSTFKELIGDIKILTPELNFSQGYASGKESFIELATSLGINKADAGTAFQFALSQLMNMLAEFSAFGKLAIKELEKDPNQIAIVLFGRSYNAFAKEANLGIPQKFSSRNLTLIPHDFIPSTHLESYENMYWGSGNQILRSARYVKNHAQLFGTYITNFSCGPDSMMIPYFRKIMGNKPSLTLELDSHSADAGLNTRIEAAIDIINRYRELTKKGMLNENITPFKQVEVHGDIIIDSNGKKHNIRDQNVKVLIPSMGRFATEAFAAAFRFSGINSEPLPVYTFETLKTGRGLTTSKECIPLTLCAGAMVNHQNANPKEDEITLMFMSTGCGPCRQGQYTVYLKDIIANKNLKNHGIFTLTDEDSYSGLGTDFVIRGFTALTIADVYQNVYNAVAALAVDREKALERVDKEWEKIVEIIEKGAASEVYNQLEKTARELSSIEKICSLENAVKVALVGEIFVRNEDFSRRELVQKLLEQHIVIKTAPIGEYLFYANYQIKRLYKDQLPTLNSKLRFKLREIIQRKVELKIKATLAKSGFYESEPLDIENIVNHSKALLPLAVEGEAILTIGSALADIVHHASGIVSLGPFGCMPSRLAESILNVNMNVAGKEKAQGKPLKMNHSEIVNLPFLSVETDGNLFPQIIQSKLEIFILQTTRLHKALQKSSEEKQKRYSYFFLKKLKEQFRQMGYAFIDES